MSALYLGVDGGGTKTEFVLIDRERSMVARWAGGTSDHLQVGCDGVVTVLRDGVARVCADAGVSTGELGFAFFGLPAYGEDKVIDPRLDQACGALLGHRRYRCGNDMVCGWAGSLDCGDGINLVAGTGSIGYGERQGQAARIVGWGDLFGDEGSAHWIAIQGLNLFSRMSDGRAPVGPLHAAMVEALALDDDLDLCARTMGEAGMARGEIAALAPLVAAAADQGDAAAGAILDQAAGELAVMARSLRTALGFGPDERALLSWSGGVLNHFDRVRDGLRRQLGADGGFALVEPRHPPGLGAALYALHCA